MKVALLIKVRRMNKTREVSLQQEKQANSTNSFNNVGIPISAAGPSCTNDDPSSPVNAAEASNAFKDHLFE
ncbi:hypothetical protein Tco_1549426 [Tanacetum coccineum]